MRPAVGEQEIDGVIQAFQRIHCFRDPDKATHIPL